MCSGSWVSVIFAACFEREKITIAIGRQTKYDRLAADGAVFNVLLTSAGRIHICVERLATIGTTHGVQLEHDGKKFSRVRAVFVAAVLSEEHFCALDFR